MSAFHILVHLPPGICMHLFVSIHNYLACMRAYIYERVFRYSRQNEYSLHACPPARQIRVHGCILIHTFLTRTHTDTHIYIYNHVCILGYSRQNERFVCYACPPAHKNMYASILIYTYMRNIHTYICIYIYIHTWTFSS
jgi:hypothetical protein